MSHDSLNGHGRSFAIDDLRAQREDPEEGMYGAFPTLPLTYRPNSPNNNSQIVMSSFLCSRLLILKSLVAEKPGIPGLE